MPSTNGLGGAPWAVSVRASAVPRPAAAAAPPWGAALAPLSLAVRGPITARINPPFVCNHPSTRTCASGNRDLSTVSWSLTVGAITAPAPYNNAKNAATMVAAPIARGTRNRASWSTPAEIARPKRTPGTPPAPARSQTTTAATRSTTQTRWRPRAARRASARHSRAAGICVIPRRTWIPSQKKVWSSATFGLQGSSPLPFARPARENSRTPGLTTSCPRGRRAGQHYEVSSRAVASFFAVPASIASQARHVVHLVHRYARSSRSLPGIARRSAAGGRRHRGCELPPIRRPDLSAADQHGVGERDSRPAHDREAAPIGRAAREHHVGDGVPRRRLRFASPVPGLRLARPSSFRHAHRRPTARHPGIRTGRAARTISWREARQETPARGLVDAAAAAGHARLRDAGHDAPAAASRSTGGRARAEGPVRMGARRIRAARGYAVGSRRLARCVPAHERRTRLVTARAGDSAR